MKIVIVDGYVENPGDLSWEPIARLGELVVHDRCDDSEEAVIECIGDADIALVNKVAVTKRVIDECKNLKFIAVLATGYDVIDTAYAKEKGIPVSNVPAYGTASVSQYAIALLLEICGHVAAHSQAVHEGEWAKRDWTFWDYPMIELAGKTMGIIGFGRIGQATGRIAKALGMELIAYNRSQSEEGRRLAEYVSLDELFRRSDVISLHCPLTPAVEGIINKENIEKMKDGVIIINNSRGKLVVDEDLAAALHSGKVYAAGLDVVSVEPIEADNPLLGAPNCFITPHQSWTPKESRARIMDTTAENIAAFLSGSPKNVVNP